MALNKTLLLCAVALFGFTASSALAGPLPADPNALVGYKGASAFSGTAGAATLKASVEYAVYAPGAFATSAALGFPTDPSGGTQYVYAYEVLNNLGGSSRVVNLSVSLIPTAAAANVTNNAGTPELGLAPDLSQLIPVAGNPKTNVKWTWTPTLFTTGLHSDILLFTSPYAPQFLVASMQGGNTTAASSTLPSPVPEPTTLVLGGSALFGLLAFRSVRRRKV